MGKDMDLNFEIFMIVLLVLAIVVVGNFLLSIMSCIIQ